MLTVTMSSKGQIVIPKPFRHQLLLQQGTQLAVHVEGERLILQKSAAGDWRRWEGAFRDLDLLKERARERRRELKRDRERAR